MKTNEPTSETLERLRDIGQRTVRDMTALLVAEERSGVPIPPPRRNDAKLPVRPVLTLAQLAAFYFPEGVCDQ